VALKTCKTAQTGVLHIWKLHANDYNVRIYLMHAMIWLAMLYGMKIEHSGLLFLRVSSTGAVMQPMPKVCDSPLDLNVYCLLLSSRPVRSLAMCC
jgi:hypothetical protein